MDVHLTCCALCKQISAYASQLCHIRSPAELGPAVTASVFCDSSLLVPRMPHHMPWTVAAGHATQKGQVLEDK